MKATEAELVIITLLAALVARQLVKSGTDIRNADKAAQAALEAASALVEHSSTR